MKHNRIAARCLAGFISAATVLGILTGCNSESPNSSVTEEPSSVSAISSGVEQEEGKVVLSYPDYMQELGCEDPVVLDSEPKRVVSLTRGPVLALYELGVPLIAIPSTNGDVWPEGLISQAEQLGVRGTISILRQLSPWSLIWLFWESAPTGISANSLARLWRPPASRFIM